MRSPSSSLSVLYQMVSLYLGPPDSKTADVVSWSPFLYGFTDELQWRDGRL
jgi:hypothetical protein